MNSSIANCKYVITIGVSLGLDMLLHGVDIEEKAEVHDSPLEMLPWIN